MKNQGWIWKLGEKFLRLWIQFIVQFLHKASDEIFTIISTIICFGRTFINVLTVHSVRGNSVSIWAYAAIAPYFKKKTFVQFLESKTWANCIPNCYSCLIIDCLPGVLWHLKAHKTLSSTHSFISSHIPKGPGANPAEHEQSKPPSLLVQVPISTMRFCQI